MAPPVTVAFSCGCNEVRGSLSDVAPSSGTRLTCHCRDCRAAQLFLNQPDPEPDGVDLFQTTPDKVRFEAGAERLAVFRLGPKGPLRWYATCCGVPLFNTLAKPGLPFSAIHVARLSEPDAIGPVRARAFIPTAGGTAHHKGAALMAWRLVTRMGAARLSGAWRQTPFFDPASGAPTAPVRVLTKAERTAIGR